MEKKLYRGYILVAHKMGKTPVEIFNELSLAYSDAAPCYMTVCRWVVRFSEGIEDLKDFDRPEDQLQPSHLLTSALYKDLYKRIFIYHMTEL